MMSERLENKCRALIARQEYSECEREIVMSMVKMPHSAVPHNLMGILLEKEHKHILAMKHFRAAYGEMFPSGVRICAYTDEDCQMKEES